MLPMIPHRVQPPWMWPIGPGVGVGGTGGSRGKGDVPDVGAVECIYKLLTVYHSHGTMLPMHHAGSAPSLPLLDSSFPPLASGSTPNRATGGASPYQQMARPPSSAFLNPSQGTEEEGSHMLRPSAPVYSIELDPAALNPATASSRSVGMMRNGSTGGMVSRSSSSGAGVASDTVQNHQGGSMVRDSQPYVAVAGTSRASLDGVAVIGTSATSARVVPNGYSTLGAVGAVPGQLSRHSSSSGRPRRPRLGHRVRSSHAAAVEGIAAQQAVLQERYAGLKDKLSREPGGVELGERQQLERLKAALDR